jgi:hypothetical protein
LANSPKICMGYVGKNSRLKHSSCVFILFVRKIYEVSDFHLWGRKKKYELNWSNKQIMTWLYSPGYECGTHTFMSLTLFCRAKRIHNKHDSANSNHNCGHDSLFSEPYFNLVVNIHTCIYLLFLWKLYIHQSLSKLG